MNTRTTNEIPAKSVGKSCYKCGYIYETSEKTCPECGKVLEPVTRIKTTGAIQIILGGGLLLFMGRLALWMLNANSNDRFHGGAKDILFIVFIFALVASIGFGAFCAGVWQIVFGRRNKLVLAAMIFLGIAFAAAGFGVMLNK